MGSSTGERHKRQEVSSEQSNPRVEGSNPATGEFICSNTILADLPEWSTLGRPRILQCFTPNKVADLEDMRVGRSPSEILDLRVTIYFTILI